MLPFFFVSTYCDTMVCSCSYHSSLFWAFHKKKKAKVIWSKKKMLCQKYFASFLLVSFFWCACASFLRWISNTRLSQEKYQWYGMRSAKCVVTKLELDLKFHRFIAHRAVFAYEIHSVACTWEIIQSSWNLSQSYELIKISKCPKLQSSFIEIIINTVCLIKEIES